MISSHLAHDVPRPSATAEIRVRVTALLVCTLWFEVLLDNAPAATSMPAWLAAATGAGTLLLFTVGESAAAATAWRLMGYGVGWGALLPRLLIASSPDTLALSIASGRTRVALPLAAWLAGPRAGAPGPATSGLAFAFAAAGALTFVRLLLSAHLQAGAARASFARALVVAGGMWLSTRALMWWAFDLLEGRSFQP